MSLKVEAIPIEAALPLLEQVLGGPDLTALAPHLTQAWAARTEAGDLRGALALRPSPAHGAEVLGGALAGPDQLEAALTLLQAAYQAGGRLYAYADDALVPTAALHTAGWREVGAYASLSGALPDAAVHMPGGVNLVPLADLHDLSRRLAAQRTYSDRIGHTFVTETDVQPGAGGVNETLSRVALDGDGQPLGICRAWLEGSELAVGSPGVRPDWRGGPLRRTLLLAVCGAAQRAGATTLTVDSWGDTEEERAEDLALGLKLIAFSPIYGAPN